MGICTYVYVYVLNRVNLEVTNQNDWDRMPSESLFRSHCITAYNFTTACFSNKCILKLLINTSHPL